MRCLKRCLSSITAVSVVWAALPTLAFAAVEITEVAWMGTVESQYGEWIELYNSGSEAVSLDGWKLYTDGGSTLLISLTKTIAAGGYLVVERTTPSAPNPLPTISDEAGSFGGAGLANTGEYLVLKDTSGSTVSVLAFQSGWPAGDAETKQTMQKKGSSWITADPTPKAATTSTGTTGTAAESADDDSSEETTGAQKSAGGGSAEPELVWEPGISFSYPKQVIAGVPVQITATVTEEKGMTKVGHFTWNLGEGTVFQQRLLEPITYTYQHPGEYIVTLAYVRREAITPDPDLVGQFSISVVHPVLAFERGDGGTLFIKNTSTENLDLYQWRLGYAGMQHQFPRYSIIKAGSRLPVSAVPFGAAAFSELPTLVNPSGIAVAGPEVPVTAVASTVRSVAVAQKPLPAVAAVTVAQQPLLAQAAGALPKNNQRTWSIAALGALVVIGIALFLLLERFKAREE